jgi:hypothetical protein
MLKRTLDDEDIVCPKKFLFDPLERPMLDCNLNNDENLYIVNYITPESLKYMNDEDKTYHMCLDALIQDRTVLKYVPKRFWKGEIYYRFVKQDKRRESL